METLSAVGMARVAAMNQSALVIEAGKIRRVAASILVMIACCLKFVLWTGQTYPATATETASREPVAAFVQMGG